MRYRLATIQVGFALFIAMLFATATGIWLFQDLEQQFIREQYNLVEVFTAQAFLSVYVGDIELADDIVQSLVGDNILFAQIVKDGQVVAEERKIDLTLPVENVPVTVTGKRNQYQQIPYLDLTRGLIGRPGSQNDEHVQSYVRLGISLVPLEAIFRQQLWVFALISVGVAGVGALLGWLIYRDLWSPVARLIQTVKTFGTGDLSAQVSVDPEGHSQLLSIGQGWGAYKLLRHAFNQPHLGLAGFETASSLAEKTPCFELQHNDLAQAHDALAALF